jgi:hypothetical protein
MNIIKKIGCRNFVKEIDKNIKVKFQKYDMQCDVDDEIVYIGKSYNIDTDRYFMDYVKELSPKCKTPMFLLSILHEIGHIMTWTDDNADLKETQFALLEMGYQEGEIDLEECCNMYFRIPLESNATIWAIEFAEDHPDLIKKYLWLCE